VHNKVNPAIFVCLFETKHQPDERIDSSAVCFFIVKQLNPYQHTRLYHRMGIMYLLLRLLNLLSSWTAIKILRRKNYVLQSEQDQTHHRYHTVIDLFDHIWSGLFQRRPCRYPLSVPAGIFSTGIRGAATNKSYTCTVSGFSRRDAGTG